MKIAIEGCCHGEIEVIYETLEQIMNEKQISIDLLICCGDFQCFRNVQDLRTMSAPPKHLHMGSFYKYYSGEKIAPIPTVFIHGNHEAVNYLKELYFGGWVAPNIYYMGYSGVITFGGIRIAGISGIFKHGDYQKGYYEYPPYSGTATKSSFHMREFEKIKMSKIEGPVDIMISHDWPLGITKYGNESRLLKIKPYFKEDILNNSLGSPALRELLFLLKPKFWFAAHMHVKFAALVPHNNEGNEVTRFLSLDKCVPGRNFLQIIEIDSPKDKEMRFEYDLDWISILHSSQQFYDTSRFNVKYPEFFSKDISKKNIIKKLRDPKSETDDQSSNSIDLAIPYNFQVTSPIYDPLQPIDQQTGWNRMPAAFENSQTVDFASKFDISLSKSIDEKNISCENSVPKKVKIEKNKDEIDIEVFT